MRVSQQALDYRVSNTLDSLAPNVSNLNWLAASFEVGKSSSSLEQRQLGAAKQLTKIARLSKGDVSLAKAFLKCDFYLVESHVALRDALFSRNYISPEALRLLLLKKNSAEKVIVCSQDHKQWLLALVSEVIAFATQHQFKVIHGNQGSNPKSGRQGEQLKRSNVRQLAQQELQTSQAASRIRS